jgi:tripartite-type tricarboxylate transporter receptor subunit TctC
MLLDVRSIEFPPANGPAGSQKRVSFVLCAAVCLIVAATQALAQSWPQQAIHLIISFGAGGGADIVGRILADAMQNRLGQPVVVENKPGAGGILGNELVASAKPDGYTLGIAYR